MEKIFSKLILNIVIYCIVFIVFSLTKLENTYAQSTVSLTCENIYNDGLGSGVCDDDAYCKPNTVFYYGTDLCYGWDELSCSTRSSTLSQEMLYCQDGRDIEYCCIKKPEILVGTAVDLKDRIQCEDTGILGKMLKESTVDEAITAEGCKSVSKLEDFTEPSICDVEHRCIIDSTRYFCCGGYLPPGEKGPEVGTQSFKGCDDIDDPAEKEKCNSCLFVSGDSGETTGAIWTELGCIDPSPAGIITRVFQIAIGVMGGVLIFLFAKLAMAYNSENPDQIAQAPGMIWSIAGGVIMLIAGIIILRFLGINVLGLPSGFLG